MKKIFFLVILSATVQGIFAQWTTSGSHIYNSNSGNVGIGTTSPADLLQVAGNIGFRSRTLNNTIDYIGRSGSLGNNAAWMGFGVDGSSNNFLTFGTVENGVGGGERMRLDYRGFLGIGTATPAAKLTVLTSFGSLASSIRNEDATNGYGLAIESEGTTSTRYAFTVRNLAATNTYFHVSTETGMVGYVGIGTASPNAKLTVNGNFSFGERVITTHYIGHTAANNFGGNSAWQSFSTDGTDEWISFGTLKSGVSGGERMRIDPSGNLGIGTTSPSEKLSVNGNAYINGNISSNGFITTKKLTVTQSGWSDYVFNKDYKLRSLSSLETFINQYKRLPEMPSAKEVEEKGISVGDNQALLLKKIEELTLYMIKMNKDNAEMKKEIQQLKTQTKKK